MKTGFIGLGSMGLPMATNLLRAGHEVRVFNRTASRAETIRAQAKVSSSPAEAAQDAECVITMLADDAAVEAVVFDTKTGILGAMKPGTVHIAMSTMSVALSKHLAEVHASAGHRYVAAPVFGRPEAAAAAKLWVIAAGKKADVEACTPLFDAVGQGMFHVGEEPSSANVVKIAGNFMIMSMLESMGEAFAFVRKQGVDAEVFLNVLTGTLFRVPVYENYGKNIVEERFEPAGFKLRLGLKDVRLALEAADAAGVPMPVASIIHSHYLTMVAQGKGEIDWAALASLSVRNAGLGK